MRPLRPLAVLALACCAAPLSGCVVVHRPVESAVPAAGSSAPDLARKPGAVAASDGGDSTGPVAWTSERRAVAPRVDVHAGAMRFDGSMDLDPAAYVGVRVAWPTGRGFDVEVPVKVAWVEQERFVPPPPSSTAPGTTVEEEGVVVFVEPGVRLRRTFRPGGRRVEGSLGAGAGLASFSGFGDDDTAFSAQMSATLGVFLSSRLSVFLDAQGHAILTDVGGDDRTFRTAGAIGVGLSWDF